MSPSSGNQSTAPEPVPLRPTGPCWVCGGDRFRRVFTDVIDLRYWPQLAPFDHGSHPAIHLLRCRSCGFSQPDALVDLPYYFDVIYQWSWDEAQLRLDFESRYRDGVYNDILASLDGLLPEGVPRTLLDVGCSTGRFVRLAVDHGWDSEGVEIDAIRADFAARQTGRTIHSCRVQELALEGKRFAGVTLNDVLEHVPHPAAMVRELRGLVQPGGILAIKVPHGPMQCLKEGVRRHLLGRRDALHDRVGVLTNLVHVSLFSVGSLRRLLTDSGFRVIEVTTAAAESDPLHAGMNRMRDMMARSAVRVARTLPYGVHTPLSFNLQVYATPTGG